MGLIARQAQPGFVPLRINYHAFLGTIWAGVAISGLVLACRLYSRFRVHRRLFWDDPFAIFAFILILTTGAIWQARAKDMYYFISAIAGIVPTEPDLLVRRRRWLVASFVVEIFFYTSLISIKLSFLFFFKRLGSGINYFKYIWWPVLFLCISAYLASIGDISYTCLLGSNEDLIGKCTTSKEKNSSNIAVKVNCSFDVFTDFLIMLLPTILLWNARIPRKKKIAILCLFSLSIITMAIATARAATIAITQMPNGDDDVSYLWLWSAVEPPVALIVSCLSSCPQLFVRSSQSEKPSFNPSQTYLQRISRIRAKNRKWSSPWVNLPNDSRSHDLNHTRIGHDIEMHSMTSKRSGEVILVPQNCWPVAYAYTGPSNDTIVVPEHQIARQFELSVTNQPMVQARNNDTSY